MTATDGASKRGPFGERFARAASVFLDRRMPIILLLGFSAGLPLEEATAQARHINAQRLQATLEKLSEFGRNPEGGVTRLGFSQTELDARWA